jgi:hypothetical protein
VAKSKRARRIGLTVGHARQLEQVDSSARSIVSQHAPHFTENLDHAVDKGSGVVSQGGSEVHFQAQLFSESSGGQNAEWRLSRATPVRPPLDRSPTSD